MSTRKPVKAVSYRLPESTIEQIRALSLDLDPVSYTHLTLPTILRV